MSIVTVALIGFDQRSYERLAYSLSKRGADRCRVGSGTDTDVLIVDLDSDRADGQIKAQSQELPLTPIIGICSQKTDLPNVVHLVKPFRIADLLELIDELAMTSTTNQITDEKINIAMEAVNAKRAATSLGKRLDETKSKARPARPLANISDEMCFNPERFLLGAIHDALAQGQQSQQTAVITCWKDKVIIVPFDKPWLLTNLQDKQIRNLAIAPVDDHLSSPISVKYDGAGSGDIQALQQDPSLNRMSKEVFLWNLAVLTCRGRIPSVVSVTDRYCLSRWPNLTRMIVPSSALRILALWTSNVCTISEIKDQLDVPVQEVLTVFSAAYFSGLAKFAKRRSDELLEPEIHTDGQQRNLLGMIMRRLEKLHKRQPTEKLHGGVEA